eukprot:5747875-Alexandrium_andersonii.AAC.1
MSASLVGSEMCIRDRFVARATGRARGWNNCLWSAPEPSRCSWAPGPRGTVSYTHLTLPTICSV